MSACAKPDCAHDHNRGPFELKRKASEDPIVTPDAIAEGPIDGVEEAEISSGEVMPEIPYTVAAGPDDPPSWRKCPECPTIFKGKKLKDSNRSFKKHYLAKHTMFRYTCDQCDKEFTQTGDLSVHKKKEHEGKRWNCEVEDCDKIFTDPSHLAKHTQSAHEGKTWDCPEDGCGASFTHPSNLATHTQSAHEGKTWDCDVDGCGASYTFPAALRTHVQSVHEGKTWDCEVEGCDASYGDPAHLCAHFKTQHTADYIQTKKREETIVADLLKETLSEKPLGGWLSDMKQQLPVDYRCAPEGMVDYGCGFAKLDFSFPAENTPSKNNQLIVLEVDEYQHRWRAVVEETARMYNCTTSWLTQNAFTSPRVVWIRYNPHAFKVDGETKRTTKKERHEKLLALMDELASEPADANVSAVRIFYLFYSTEGGRPCVLDEEDYFEPVKEWYWRAIV